MAKRELPATIRDRYRISSNRKKSRILDEFIAVTGHHRDHGVRLQRSIRILLGHRATGAGGPASTVRRRWVRPAPRGSHSSPAWLILRNFKMNHYPLARTIAKSMRKVYKGRQQRDGGMEMEEAESLFKCLEQVPNPRKARGV